MSDTKDDGAKNATTVDATAKGLDAARLVGPVFLDPYVIVNADNTVIDFNPHYRALFSRAQARRLKGSACCQFLRLSICDSQGCLAQSCREANTPARYDEIPATLEGDDTERRFIASAQPLGESTLILLRDVSDLADVQRKYKLMHAREAKEKTRLREVIHSRTQELLEANRELNRAQKELVQFKKGLFG